MKESKLEGEKKISFKTAWQRWMQGQWLVKYIPFALFLSLLAIIYIANGHYTDNTIRNIGKAQQQLKHLKYEYLTLKSDLMYRSKESQLALAVQPLGLKKLSEPPINIAKADKTNR